MSISLRAATDRAARLFLSSLLVAGIGCSGGGEPNDGDGLGQAVVALTQAPPDVGCLQITAAGSRTVVQSYDVMPGASTTFTLTGLALGNVSFSGAAYTTGCSSVTPSSV